MTAELRHIERLPHIRAGVLLRPYRMGPAPDSKKTDAMAALSPSALQPAVLSPVEAAARQMDAAARVARPGQTWTDARPSAPMPRLPAESAALRTVALARG